MTTKELTKRLQDYYGQPNAAKIVLTMDWLAEQNLTDEQNAMVFYECTTTHEWFPGMAGMKPIVQKITGRTPDRAWFILLAAIGETGAYNSPRFEDSRIAEAVRLVWGTWEALCTDTQKTNFMRANFIKAYNETLDYMTYDKHLIGIMEAKNGRFETRFISSEGRCVESIPGRPRDQVITRKETFKISEGNRV